MAGTVEASGSVALVVAAAATTLGTITTNRILCVVLDLNAANSSDTFQVKVTTKVRSSGIARDFISSVLTGGSSQPVYFSVPIDSPYSAVFTIQQLTGTNRSVPWRIESIGAVTVETEGTQRTVISSEHILATISSNRNVSLVVDLGNMSAGDTVELRMKQRIRSSDVTHEEVFASYSGVQSVPIVQSIPITSPFECICTIKQTVGVVDDFDWRVDSF